MIMARKRNPRVLAYELAKRINRQIRPIAWTWSGPKRTPESHYKELAPFEEQPENDVKEWLYLADRAYRIRLLAGQLEVLAAQNIRNLGGTYEFGGEIEDDEE